MTNPAPLYRDDTLFGVCEALGEDFGFNANILRALLGVGLLFSPVNTVFAYVAAAILAGVTRWFLPDAVVLAAAVEDKAEPIGVADEPEELALAA